MSTKSIRMTEGNIKSIMIKFAFPIFLGSLFQQFYNIVDAIVVGNIVGQEALAAVSSTGSLVFLLVGFFGGVFSGASVIISRYFGAKDDEQVKRAVGTTVFFGLVSGILLSLIGTIFSPWILRLMGTPSDVFADAVAYLRTYFSGIIFVVLYNTACGIFQAVGDSKRPLYYLLTSSAINVVLDLLFVAGMNMGVKGAAIATVISQAISSVLAFVRLNRIKEVYHVGLKTICVDKEILKGIINIGLPSGIQNSVIALANVVVQSSINSFGSVAMAGNGAYSKIEGFAFIPINAFTASITTFVSQNLGAKQSERAKEGAKFGVIFACVLAELIGVLFILFAPQLISIFGKSPEVIAVGAQRAYVCSWFFFLLSFSHCIASVLRGAGMSKIPMFIMLSIWCVLRVAYINLVNFIFHKINLVFWAYPLTWFISSILFLYYYKKSKWYEVDL